MKLALDNAAGRSFFHRSGVGRIRHISLRVLWVQQKVREKFLSVGPVSTKHNPSDLGTKNLNQNGMLYLMFLCKVYDLSTSQYVGSDVNGRLEQETVTRKGIKIFTLAGMKSHDAKALMRVMLVSALSLNRVTATTPDLMVVDTSYFSFFFAVVVTILCITLGYVAVLRKELRELRGEKSQFEWNGTLSKELNLLKRAKDGMQSKKAATAHAEGFEEEKKQMMRAWWKPRRSAMSAIARALWTRYLIQGFGSFGTMGHPALLMNLLNIDAMQMAILLST